MSKPRVGFCWWCGLKLHGGKHRVVHADNKEYITHIACAKPAEIYLNSGHLDKEEMQFEEMKSKWKEDNNA